MGNAFVSGQTAGSPGSRELAKELTVSLPNNISNGASGTLALSAEMPPGMYQAQLTGSVEGANSSSSYNGSIVLNLVPRSSQNGYYMVQAAPSLPPQYSTPWVYTTYNFAFETPAFMWNVDYFLEVMSAGVVTQFKGNFGYNVAFGGTQPQNVMARNLNMAVKLWRVKI